MEKQQVQLTRMHFVDEIPEEVERLFRKSASSFSHSLGEPLIELTNLLEQKNYIVFLEKLYDFREQLGRADMLLEDCTGIIKSFISITTQSQEANHKQDAQHNSADNIDIEALMQSMKEQAQKAQDLQKNLEKNNVQEG
jgi:hypothetical protein